MIRPPQDLVDFSQALGWGIVLGGIIGLWVTRKGR